ncbi:hypothetical protein [Nitrososphaeria virus YSH_1032793]|uniref:Uncharacterized protein n=1 Tax=Nitrososphaeria virus YSH_1032793 TaxID=3071320 RepID=A0A976UAB8_9CAUD|nr:hypothetical protein QKV91_gp17 [Yangshan Harbor Nitrososphaeria virus]UVF62221.1 hypothetical protein [Nitrososphaeria virus YSH_1032793]
MSLNKIEERLVTLISHRPALINDSNTKVCFEFWNFWQPNTFRTDQWNKLTPAESITRCLRKIKNNPLNKIEEQAKYRIYSKQ